MIEIGWGISEDGVYTINSSLILDSLIEFTLEIEKKLKSEICERFLCRAISFDRTGTVICGLLRVENWISLILLKK